MNLQQITLIYYCYYQNIVYMVLQHFYIHKFAYYMHKHNQNVNTFVFGLKDDEETKEKKVDNTNITSHVKEMFGKFNKYQGFQAKVSNHNLDFGELFSSENLKRPVLRK